MRIPTLNPLRFYKPGANKLKDNLSFAEASDYWNALPGSYTPKFLNKTENVIYQDAISGAYSFSSIDEFITSGATNPVIENCKACIDSGSIIYTNLDGAVIGKKLIVKIEGNYDIEVREDTTVVDLFTGQSGIFTYVLDQNYTNLTVKISSTEKICILGILLCEPTIQYSVCDYTQDAELIDCCPFGGVYLLTSNIDWFTLNNTIAEELDVYSLDFTGTSDASPTIDYRIKIGTDIYEFAQGSALFDDTDVLNGFVASFDWIETDISGLILTVTLPAICGAVSLLVYENDALRDTYNFTLDDTIVDENYLYTNNDANINTIEGVEISVASFGSLPRSNEEFLCNDGLTNAPFVMETNEFYQTNGNIIDITDETADFTNSSYVQISKTGQIFTCCRFEVGDYYSEYFTVITQTQKESLKLINLVYSSEFMDLNVAFSSSWTASLLINAELMKGSGSDIEVFVGQQNNTNLENFAKKIRILKTGAIPDYLCDMLSNVFGFDTITIEGEEYAAEDGPEEASFEDRTDLFQLEIKLRKQNFEFLI
jgi:hypothetical protein